MMVILIEIAIENRLKWTVILLLDLETIFLFLYSVRLHHVSLFYDCLNNAVDESCLPPPFHSDSETHLIAFCLSPFCFLRL